MAAEWTEVMSEGVLIHVAMTEGYRLTVSGGGSAWFWSIAKNGRGIAGGVSHDLAAAKGAAEAVARRLAGEGT